MRHNEQVDIPHKTGSIKYLRENEGKENNNTKKKKTTEENKTRENKQRLQRCQIAFLNLFSIPTILKLPPSPEQRNPLIVIITIVNS